MNDTKREPECRNINILRLTKTITTFCTLIFLFQNATSRCMVKELHALLFRAEWSG